SRKPLTKPLCSGPNAFDLQVCHRRGGRAALFSTLLASEPGGHCCPGSSPDLPEPRTAIAVRRWASRSRMQRPLTAAAYVSLPTALFAICCNSPESGALPRPPADSSASVLPALNTIASSQKVLPCSVPRYW